MSRTDIDRRTTWLREQVHHVLARRGAVVQTSGGIDSAVTLHLCARALGPENVTALFLPDGASDPSSREHAESVAASAGTAFVVRDIGAAIEAQQPVAEVHALVRRYFPDFDPATDGYAVNQSPSMTRRLGTQVYTLSVGPAHGEPTASKVLRTDDLRQVIAHQNRKQRTRMLFAYAEAEATDRAVVGASNGDELRTGFVVKYGDDAADLCAIGDLAKTEVYELAEQLDVPRAVIERPPTTDTFALLQGQDEYYYSLPAPDIDALLASDGDADVVARISRDNPGWSETALTHIREVFAATLRYNTTRSARFEPGGSGD